MMAKTTTTRSMASRMTMTVRVERSRKKARISKLSLKKMSSTKTTMMLTMIIMPKRISMEEKRILRKVGVGREGMMCFEFAI